MKKSLITIIAVVIATFLTSGLVLARGGHGQAGRPGGMIAAALPYEELSEAEKADLLKMVEEEKLARDVYLALYEQWSIPAFSNISNSEQRHMDAVASLLDKYGLENPVAGLEAGSFATPEVQELYQQLVDKGSSSDENALRVGATIEDLDIKDLNECLETTDNQDLTMVYENLKRGSENHLRAFTSLLAVYGYAPYEAQFLTQEEIDEIISTPPTRGRHGGRRGRR
jgi:hypothetical protein